MVVFLDPEVLPLLLVYAVVGAVAVQPPHEDDARLPPESNPHIPTHHTPVGTRTRTRKLRRNRTQAQNVQWRIPGVHPHSWLQLRGKILQNMGQRMLKDFVGTDRFVSCTRFPESYSSASLEDTLKYHIELSQAIRTGADR